MTKVGKDLTLYLIETPFNAFAYRADLLEELPDLGLIYLLLEI